MAARVKQKPIDRLMAAMDRCAIARGEANWTDGYRASADLDESARLWNKEVAQWKQCSVVEERFRRLALRLLTEARDGRR